MAGDQMGEETVNQNSDSQTGAEIGESRLQIRPIETEMKTSYINYAMSVIIGRALPDVRDGLKPVQRRILYTMNEMGLSHDKQHKKCARVVGDCLGRYHPHGDVAVYDALIRMAQDFSLRYPLVDGQGNVGSVDGDPPAAMRYVECRMAKISNEILADIDKETVGFVDNFDSTLKEPVVLPSRIPNLLINGASGIAVGMATNMPPHNLSEVLEGVIMLMDNPDAGIQELMQVIKGPDFPTGGIICGVKGIYDAYATGKGSITIRAKMRVENHRIIVEEIPYMVNKAETLKDIADKVKEGIIEGITDIRDESDREGIRIVIELRKDAIPEIVMNQLYAHSNMQVQFGVINLALVNNQPRVLQLKDLLLEFIKHRKDVVRRRTEYELRGAQERCHVLEGLIIALENIDELISIIKEAKAAEDAKTKLMSRFSLSETQAKAVLDMKLQKLTGMESEGIRKEYAEICVKIENFRSLLADEKKIMDVIKKELLEIKDRYGDGRRTEIIPEIEETVPEDLIPVQDVVITITKAGYIKRVPLDIYKEQNRGGKGIIGIETKEEDFVKDVFITSTRDHILFFTNKGRCYQLKAYRIPEAGRYSAGRAIVNLLPRLQEGETIHALIPVKGFDEKHFLVFATRMGIIKKTPLSEYKNPRASGIIAINLREGDEVVNTALSDGNQQIILASRRGQAVRFDENDVRSMGRNATGVIGIRLEEDDEVVSMTLVGREEVEQRRLLTVTENGYGKLTPVSEYRRTMRGAKGVRTIIVNERNGYVVSAMSVDEADHIIVTSKSGMMIRVPSSRISEHGRSTMGVRIMKFDQGDKVVSVTRIPAGMGQNSMEGRGTGESESAEKNPAIPT